VEKQMASGSNTEKTLSVTVVGAGVMGTALAVHLAGHTTQKNSVRLCGTEWDDQMVERLQADWRCPRLGAALPDGLKLYRWSEREQAAAGADAIILAVTSQGLSEMTAEWSKYAAAGTIMASITKGIDSESLTTMAELMEQTLEREGRSDIPVVKLAGPLRANELAHGHPAEAVFASRSQEAAGLLRRHFLSPQFRCELSADVVGTDLCASLKNAYAIAFGMADSLYPGVDNPKAALFGRIAAEMQRIVAAYGGDPATVAGNAGIGDLYVTVQGGRNRTLGALLGSGHTLAAALEQMQGQTVEGLAAAREAWPLAKRLEAQEKLVIERDLPLFARLQEILSGEKTASQALADYWAMSDIA
jgi:glycerol-3-phosphate dehydrogenase (NAD(P)+)